MEASLRMKPQPPAQPRRLASVRGFPEMKSPLLAASGLVLLGGVSSAQVTRNYQVLALQGGATPSVSPAATYGGLGGEPRIGSSGHVVFGGFVGNNGSNNYAIWTGLPGAISKLAVQNDPTPGRPGETLDIFNTSSSTPNWICGDGTAAFLTKTLPSGDNGVWMGKPGSLQEVAIVNNPVPGIPGATFINFPGFLFQANGDGHVALRGFFQGAGITSANDSGVWIGKVGDLPLVAREGSPAADLGPTVLFNDLTFNSFSLNSHGQLCLIAGVSTHPLTDNTSLFLGNRNGLVKILQKGEVITSFPGLAWDTFGKPHLNDDGTFLIESTPTPGGKISFFTRKSTGVVTRIAEQTAAAPGAAGLTWNGFFYSDPSLAGNDFATFGAGLDPGSNFDRDGIWVASGSTTRLVAREGDAAPGLAGQTFASFASDDQGPAANESGTVVFQAATNTGVNGIWRWRNGDLRLLLTPGDFLQIGPSDSREVTSFSVKLGSGGQSGVPSGLNDRGQLVVKVSFKFGTSAVILINDILDQDGDGLDSLLEEAFGGNPDNPADGAGQSVELRKIGADLKLVFRRRTDGSFQYQPETSGDLANPASWVNLTAIPQLSADQSGLPPGIERVEVSLPATATRLFSRVGVIRVSP